jgi:RNA polymerase sigma factor (sigma-70 family)
MYRFCRDWSKVEGRSLRRQRAWLWKVMKSAATDWHRLRTALKRNLHRERWLTPEEMETAGVDPNPSPRSLCFNKERADEVRKAVEQLPDGIRQVIQLRRLSGLSLRQTARELGITVYMVQVWEDFGIKILRDNLIRTLGKDL